MITVRTAMASDAADLLAWRNDPVTRMMSRDTAPVSEAVNAKWFRDSLSLDSRILLVLEDEQGKVGVIRFDENSAGDYEISINLNPNRRGERLCKPVIEAAIDHLRQVRPVLIIRADVKVDNEPSKKCFVAGGFRFIKVEGEFCHFVREFSEVSA